MNEKKFEFNAPDIFKRAGIKSPTDKELSIYNRDLQCYLKPFLEKSSLSQLAEMTNLFSLGFFTTRMKLCKEHGLEYSILISKMSIDRFILLYFANINSNFNSKALDMISNKKKGTFINTKDVSPIIYRLLKTVLYVTRNLVDGIDEVRLFLAKDYLSSITFITKGGKTFPFLESTAVLRLARDNDYDVFYKSGFDKEIKDFFCYGKVSKDGKLLHERTMYLQEFKHLISKADTHSPWKNFSTQMLSKRLIAFLLRDNMKQMYGIYDITEKEQIFREENKKINKYTLKGIDGDSKENTLIRGHKTFGK